jgi:dTDP-4-dehydrorhamnose 3,5-epimerase
MKFTETKLKGAFVIDLEPHEDERGFFARTFCAREFEQHGLHPRLVQSSISFNKQRGTLRGMHWQEAPNGECKLIRVTRGAIYDVVIDLRRGSPTFKCWFAAELTAENRRQLYVPESFAHGFQTLSDNTEVAYQMSEFFAPESSRGARWNDRAFAIEWPQIEPRIMNERDANFPDFV